LVFPLLFQEERREKTNVNVISECNFENIILNETKDSEIPKFSKYISSWSRNILQLIILFSKHSVYKIIIGKILFLNNTLLQN